jgi:hypothetical protein
MRYLILSLRYKLISYDKYYDWIVNLSVVLRIHIMVRIFFNFIV